MLLWIKDIGDLRPFVALTFMSTDILLIAYNLIRGCILGGRGIETGPYYANQN
jgi:hypothetical protein